ncbi:sulfur transfer complex subunit TusD [Salmonella bongori]|nr:sulfur transfer complex subunit TusD [Salmonella bongori]
MRYAIMVTGPAYGTQLASSALQFAHALLNEGHELASVFFYREGVYNANLLTSPASDEYDLVRAWQQLNTQYGVVLKHLRGGRRFVAVLLMKPKRSGWVCRPLIFSRALR